MRIAKLSVIAAALVAAAGLPANAAPTITTGFNNGDVGFISVTAGASVTGAASDNPLDAVVDAKCEFHQVTRPSSNQVVLAVAGHAVATPSNGQRAVATTVRCVLKNYYTGATVVNHTQANEGPVAVWAPPYILPTLATSFVVCAEAKALYSDGSYVTTDALNCINPL